MTQKRARRTYTEGFKQQMVQLYTAGKPRGEIIREYDLSGSAFDRWVQRISETGSSREKDNRTPEQEEMLRLRKQNQQLRMENDILKQAALIFAQR
jgi:transposase